MKVRSSGIRVRRLVLLLMFCGYCFYSVAEEPSTAEPSSAAPVGAIQETSPTPSLSGNVSQETSPAKPSELSSQITGSAAPPPRLSLWDMIKAGGFIMWFLIGLSVVTFIVGMYYLTTVSPGREIPPSFVKRAMAQIRAGDLRGVYQLCEGREELVAKVLRAGLKVAGHDRFIIQEAMESEGERGATQLWERISYLNYVGVIAPLLGLLGTVWGMINAFGAIAFEDAIVRGKAMASGVAQAMITTAAGLMLAIPAFVLYFYLRGRVIQIIAEMESLAGEMVEILSRSEDQ